MNYYCSIDGTDVSGPHSLVELKNFFERGSLPPSTQVCLEGQETWEPLSSIITPPPPHTTETTTATRRREVSPSKPSPKTKPSKPPEDKKTSFLSVTIPIGAIVLIAVLAFGAWRAGFFAPKISVPEIFKTQLMRCLEECSKVTAMTAQGVSFHDFSQQVASARSAYDLVGATWPEGFSTGSAPEFDKAFQGWNLAIQVWRYEIKHDGEPTEPDFHYYAEIKSYAGSYLHEETNTLDGIHYFPFKGTVGTLFSIADKHYESAKSQVLKDIQTH